MSSDEIRYNAGRQVQQNQHTEAERSLCADDCVHDYVGKRVEVDSEFDVTKSMLFIRNISYRVILIHSIK